MGHQPCQEFLAKLYFAQKSGVEIYMKLIEDQTTMCTEWLSNLQTSYSTTINEQNYERMIFQYRISQTRAMIDWLDYCRTEIQVVPSQNSEGN